MARILVVDDDKRTVALVTLYLKRAGHRVVPAYDGAEALERARGVGVDLIILDVMLPHLQGTDVARLLRIESSVPLIMVSARVAEEDRLAGFSAGADDYLTKPFSPRELVARVAAVLRRSGGSRPEDSIEVAGLVLDAGAHRVRVGDRSLDLTPTEFRVLEALMRASPGVVTRRRLIDAAYGPDYPGMDRSIDTHVSNLRRKLRLSSAHIALETVHGVGYRASGPDHAN